MAAGSVYARQQCAKRVQIDNFSLPKYAAIRGAVHIIIFKVHFRTS